MFQVVVLSMILVHHVVVPLLYYGSGCEDTIVPSCSLWAQQGHCHNPTVLFACQLSCNACDARVRVPIIVPIDVCQPNPCGQNAECRALGGRPVCTCPIGYVGDELTNCIRVECIEANHCPGHMTCQSLHCINPCNNPNICGRDAGCQTINHLTFCTRFDPAITSTRPQIPSWPLTTTRPSAGPPNRPNIFTPYSPLDLFNAATEGDLGTVNSALAAGADPLWRNPDSHGSTALHQAAATNSIDVINRLLDAGVDVNVQTGFGANVDSIGSTPIHAASAVGNVEALVTLIGRGANVNHHINAGTALMAAALHGHLPVVRELLAAGANIHAVGRPDGGTALHYAANANKQAVAALLLDQGADKHKLAITDGLTPGAWARHAGHFALGTFIDNYQGNNTG